MRRSRTLCLLAALGICAVNVAEAQPRPSEDRSTEGASDDPRSLTVRVEGAPVSGELSFTGAVQGIEASEGELRVRVDGRTLGVRGVAGLPFRVGDTIRVRYRGRVVQIHRVVDLVIEDAAGQTLLATVGSGDAAFAPGWDVSLAGVASRSRSGAATRSSHWLRLARGAHVAFVRDNAPRRIVTPSGTFVLSGHAVRWSGGPRPPDSSDYEQFFLVRLP